MKRILFFVCLLLSLNTFSAEWQWSVEMKSTVAGETNAHPRAFLWIPADCEQVRGVVVGMHNMQEEGIMEHPDFRKVMSGIGFAEIWITPGLDPLFDPQKDSQKQFDEMLNSLAEISGYQEIKYAPIVPIGHSAWASYPWNFAAWNPDKTLAILSIHGDAPQTNLTGCGRPNLDWGVRTTEGIPGLMVMGEYEWWEDRLTPAIDYKNKYPKAPVSLLADAGHGHFDHSDMLINYLALFIKKAAHYRLPDNMPKNQPIQLILIDPKQGWLADRWHKDELPHADAAPYSCYRGDKLTAFWYFDKDMAFETEKYYAQARGKRNQYIGIEQDGVLLPYDEKSHSRYNVRFNPEDDGITFHLSAVFTDSLRMNPVTEYSQQGKIKIDRLNGPARKVNDTTFVVDFYRMGLNNPKRTGDIWLIAHQEGDDVYKSTIQQINMRIPYPYTEGKPQHITFKPIPNIKKGAKSVLLNAESDRGLPISFYVKEGPAEVEGNKLIIGEIPPRAKYPLKVTVVAWQYGRSAGEKIQTAEAVERSFYIEQ